jgi:hypothetical protein
MLNLKVWTMSLGSWAATSFTLCVLGGVIFPNLPIAHRTLELVLPGFVWISPGAFVLGLVESFVLGVYTALVFVPIHNFFARHWSVAQPSSSAAKAA